MGETLPPLPVDHPAHCRAEIPIRGNAHAHQVLTIHSGHRCDRYRAAVAYIGATAT